MKGHVTEVTIRAFSPNREVHKEVQGAEALLRALCFPLNLSPNKSHLKKLQVHLKGNIITMTEHDDIHSNMPIASMLQVVAAGIGRTV